VDLGDHSMGPRLRSLIAAIDPKMPLLFAVDSGSRAHFATVQANDIGGRRILRRPLQGPQVRRALDEIGVQADVPLATGIAAEAGGALILAGANLLDGAFKSLAEGSSFRVRQAVEAGRQLLSGDQAGLGGWLDTVRKHNDGTFKHCLLFTGAAGGVCTAVRDGRKGSAWVDRCGARPRHRQSKKSPPPSSTNPAG
jgi:hypothetical protein